MHGRRHGGGCARCGPGALPGHATAPARPPRPRLRREGSLGSVCGGSGRRSGCCVVGGGDGGGSGEEKGTAGAQFRGLVPAQAQFPVVVLISCQFIFPASRADGVSDGDESRRGHRGPRRRDLRRPCGPSAGSHPWNPATDRHPTARAAAAGGVPRQTELNWITTKRQAPWLSRAAGGPPGAGY